SNDVAVTFFFTLTVKAFGDLPPHLYAVIPNSGDTGTQVNLSAANDGGNAATWRWDFGGGAAPNTSTGPSPTVTLGAEGQYAASVTATNVNGNSTFNFTLYVTAVGGLKPPNPQSVVPPSGNSGAQATFTVNCQGGTPDTWSWDFGGGAVPDTSTVANPHVTLG